MLPPTDRSPLQYSAWRPRPPPNGPANQAAGAETRRTAGRRGQHWRAEASAIAVRAGAHGSPWAFQTARSQCKRTGGPQAGWDAQPRAPAVRGGAGGRAAGPGRLLRHAPALHPARWVLRAPDRVLALPDGWDARVPRLAVWLRASVAAVGSCLLYQPNASIQFARPPAGRTLQTEARAARTEGVQAGPPSPPDFWVGLAAGAAAAALQQSSRQAKKKRLWALSPQSPASPPARRRTCPGSPC